MRTTILVSYDAGWGHHIALRGGAPLSWESGSRMQPVGSSTWQMELDLEEPLDFKPLHNDRVWAFGHRDYHVKPGETLTIEPHFFQTPGFADTIGYIPYKGRDVTVRLYTPPGYKENAARRYPVLYCVDGQEMFEPEAEAIAPGWTLDEHLNALMESRVVEPLLVVGVDFAEGASRDAPVKAEEMAAFMLRLKSTIDRAYPTRPEMCGVLGAASGGLFALWLGRKHPRSFPRVAAMGPAFWWASEDALAEIEVQHGQDPQTVYLDAGGGDADTPERVERVAERLRAEGWVEGEDLRVEVLDSHPGPWTSRLGVPLGFLFPWSGA